MLILSENLAAFVKNILEIIVPRFCAGCKKSKEALCEQCQHASFQKGFQCIICGARSHCGEFCPGNCTRIVAQMARSPNSATRMALRSVIFSGRYEGMLRDAIWQLKYSKRRELAKPLGNMLAKKFGLLASPASVLAPETNYIAVPIPLSQEKLRARGYNQAEELAKQFSRSTGIPILNNVLQKTKDTRAQVETASKQERIQNLVGVFAADEHALRTHQDKVIILIDDITTTGATLAHASRALTEARARRIMGLVVAHG